MKILVTGGLGYIGSHTVCELLDNDYEVVIVDNLYNSKMDTIDKIKEITKKDFSYYIENINNYDEMDKIFKKEKFDAIIHFAGYKAVGESVKEPIKHYENNINSTLVLLRLMNKYKVNRFVFSSSATVYDYNNKLPFVETGNLKPSNPYGNTKYMNEILLNDYANSNENASIMILRYFNPIGSHKSYLLGEEPEGIPNNLMPYIVRVANRELDHLSIFGDDYDTVDGTGVRDYIHVVDLAIGHLKALEKSLKDNGYFVYNLGTGKGTSVLELVNTFEKVNDVKIPREIVGRRAGDIAECYADTTKAKKELDFEAKYSIEDMCYDSYQYILKRKN